MACSRKDNCELFPLISINGALKIWQSFYCDGNYHTCVRYQLGLEGKPIPISLLPNGKNLDLSSASEVVEQTSGTSGSNSDDKQKPAHVTEPSVSPSVSTYSDNESSENFENTEQLTTAASNFYLRMQTNGSADLHAKIAGILHQFGVEVDMMIEKQSGIDQENKSAIFLTDYVTEKDVREALLRIGELEGVSSKPICIELEKSA